MQNVEFRRLNTFPKNIQRAKFHILLYVCYPGLLAEECEHTCLDCGHCEAEFLVKHLVGC